MASSMEVRVSQKDKLFTLLKLKKVNSEAGISVKGLNNAIVEAETVMEAEDVSWVREKVAELED